jgi:hypothetical protein
MLDIQTLALNAARQAIGPEAIRDVRIESTLDALDRPAYQFIYLIDRARTDVEPGMTSIKLRIALLDALEANQDSHTPIVGILDQQDWDRTLRA